jgi:hypothetical protein
MRFVEAIHLILQQAPTVIGFVGAGNIFQSLAPPTTAFPFIVVGAQSDDAVSPTLSSKDTLRRATVVVDCVGTSLVDAARIASHVRYDLDKSKGSIMPITNTAMVIQSVIITNDSMTFDLGSDGGENAGVFVCSVNIKIYYVATTPVPVTLTTGL